MKISLLSNVNIDSLTQVLIKQHEVYKPEGYGLWIQELINPEALLYSFKPKVVFIILDGEELLRGREDYEVVLSECSSYLENILSAHSEMSFFCSNLDLPLRKIQSVKDVRNERIVENFWYQKLLDLNQRYSNFFIFDLKRIVEEMGRNNFYSQKLWYLGGIKFSISAEKVIGKEITRLINAVEGKRKKCLVLDLDNTLWGGIVGEDGIHGLELSEYKEGARFKDFQKRIKEIKELGTILAIVSKNNKEDVEGVFKAHPDMYLKENDFVATKIGWNSKVQSLKELSEEISIDLNSFVFIDDNPFERESIKNELSSVVVPDFPKDTSELEKFITEIYYSYFLSLKTTSEDLTKTDLYRQNANRAMALQTSTSFEEFLKTLQTKIKVWKIKNSDVTRVSQLTQKTNQFNLSVKRYTEIDIKELLNSNDCDIYVSSVEDKFGNNGIVSVIIIRKVDQKIAELDTFLMSCRVIGRFIEDNLIAFVENQLRNKGFEKLVVRYKYNGKNKIVENLFERFGYELIHSDSNGNKSYEINLQEDLRTCRNEYAELIFE